MAIFDYVMLLISVVLSLGLARMLETHARLLKRGAAVKWSAVYMTWFLILAALHVDLWATLWVVHKQTHWPWTMILGFFFQAISLYYGAVLVAPDEDEPAIDLWQFHLENRRRYLPTLIVYTALGCLLSISFLPLAGFISAVYTVGLPIIVACGLAMLTSRLWAQRTIAVVMLLWFGWYFATYLPGFSE